MNKNGKNKTRVYLDYNATAPLRAEARAAMLALMDDPHNASSVHSYGRAARAAVEQARDHIGALVGAPAEQVIFNSGATEGNNTVLQYFAHTYLDEQILVSTIEHPSILEAIPNAQHIPVTPQGIVDLSALENLLKSGKTSLVSIMLANNETGIIQPVTETAALTHKHGALFHCDAVQAAGRTPININTLQIDFLTLSAHKIGGPQGAGALVLGLCGITPTLLLGGGQEKKARAGTENVAGIAGFGAAAELALAELPTLPSTLEHLRASLEFELCEITKEGNGLIIYGIQGGTDSEQAASPVQRVTNTTLLSLPGIRSEAWLMNFDLEGIALSNGSACTSGSVQPSHVLKAMGANDEESASALRISMGWATTEYDIQRFLEAFETIYNRIKG